MQRRGAGGRIFNGGAVAYELRGVYPMNEELERKAFEEWFKRDFHPDKTGPYVKEQLYFAWMARAKQESNDAS